MASSLLIFYLSQKNFGLYSTFMATVPLFFPLISLNSDSAIIRNFFFLKEHEFKIFFFNGNIVAIFSFLTIILSIYIFNNDISRALTIDKKLLILIPITAFSQFFIILRGNMWQIQKRPLLYGGYKILVTLLKILIAIIPIVIWKINFSLFLMLIVAAYLLSAFIAIYSFIREKLVKIKFSKSYIITILKFGIPLTFHNFGAWLNTSVLILMINTLLGPKKVAIYNLSLMFGMIVLITQDSFNRAFQPFFFEMLNENKDKVKKKIIKITYLFHFSILIFAIIIALLLKVLTINFFPTKYFLSSVYILPISIGYALNGMYKLHVNYLFYLAKTKFIFFITLSSGISTLVLAYLLIGDYGLWGISISFLVGNLIMFISAFFISQKFYPMPWLFITKR